MATFIQLQAQIEKLQKEAASLRKREMAETVANIKKAIAAFGLTAEDLGLASRAGSARARKGAKKHPGRRVPPAGTRSTGAKKEGALGADKRSVVAPKYRDPITGATWTGRGKRPKWLQEMLDNGGKLENFLLR